MVHHLKIMESFAHAVVEGRKKFEVRDNRDRGFQRGDEIVFCVVDKHGNNLDHMLNGCVYEITYVFSGFGLQEGYVVFGFRERRRR